MKLIYKIIFSFILIILLLALANIYSTTYVLKGLQEKRLKTSEVLLAKSLANRLFRAVIEEKTFYITDILFDEKSLREDKIEYILIFDEKGYLLAHTFLASFPKQLLKLSQHFDAGEEYRLEKIESDEISVYDIAVPIMEGIKQVGSIHIGIKSKYIQNLITPTKKISSLITFVVALVAVFIALFFTKTITDPVLKLKSLAEQVSKGRLETRINIKSGDEIGDLAKAFNKMAEELKSSQSQLIQSEKLSAMGKLSAGLAHELNSPLAGLLPLIEEYRDRAEKDSKEYKHMTLMFRACEHMTKIVKDFGAFSRKAEGKFAEVNLNEAIDSTLSLIINRLKMGKVQVVKEYTNGLPAIKGNLTELQQVILNIVKNAGEAMPGGGTLNIKTDLLLDKDMVIMKFVDDGYGIRKEDINKIFDPFFTTKSGSGGVGLGLSVSYGIIVNHGGEIAVESETGKETKFTVSLPVFNSREGGE